MIISRKFVLFLRTTFIHSFHVTVVCIRPFSPILPIFFEGQNSQLFHIANKIGQTLRYSLMMYELKRKIGDTVHLHIGDLIDTKKLREIGDINQITTFIRDQTYSLDPT